MGAFFIFILVLILLIVFIAFNLISSILGGIFNFLGLGSQKHRYSSNREFSDDKSKQYYRSEESVKRMRKFKNLAEDTGFEIVKD